MTYVGCVGCSCASGLGLVPGAAIRPPNGGTTPVNLPVRPGVTPPLAAPRVPAPTLPPAPPPPAPGVPIASSSPPAAPPASPASSSSSSPDIFDAFRSYLAAQEAALAAQAPASGGGSAPPFPASAPAAQFDVASAAEPAAAVSASAAPWILYAVLGGIVYAAARR